MNPDDPKLTAYALNELDPAERAEVEQLLRENPDALAEVEETERLATLLRSELHAEPAAPLTEEQRADVFSAAEVPVHGSNGASPVAQPANVVPLRPRWARPLALAASIAVLAGMTYVALQSFQQAPRRSRLIADFGASSAPAPATPAASVADEGNAQPGAVKADLPSTEAKPGDSSWLLKTPALAATDPVQPPTYLALAEPAATPRADLLAEQSASAAKVGEVEQVKQYFVDPNGSNQAGRYDLAQERTAQILTADPSSIAARNTQEKIAQAAGESATYNETRSRLSKNVEVAWAAPIRKFTPADANETKPAPNGAARGGETAHPANPEITDESKILAAREPLPTSAASETSGLAPTTIWAHRFHWRWRSPRPRGRSSTAFSRRLDFAMWSSPGPISITAARRRWRHSSPARAAKR